MGLLSWLMPPPKTAAPAKAKPTPTPTGTKRSTAGTRRSSATAHVPAAVRRRVIAQITAASPYLDGDDLHIDADGGIYLMTGRPGGRRSVGARIGDWRTAV
jgi:hypothetical protein